MGKRIERDIDSLIGPEMTGPIGLTEQCHSFRINALCVHDGVDGVALVRLGYDLIAFEDEARSRECAQDCGPAAQHGILNLTARLNEPNVTYPFDNAGSGPGSGSGAGVQ